MISQNNMTMKTFSDQWLISLNLVQVILSFLNIFIINGNAFKI